MTDNEHTRHRGATVQAVAPLLVVNALAVYGQLAYAYESIAPHAWPVLFRVLLAIGFATATESVALYVQWHAHDALLLKSHATARQLRRWSFLIAAVMGALNYSHFAPRLAHPTAAAIAFGLLSLLSPWMWGLHTRRAARVQLLKERRADEGGAEFSSERRRAFPVHTWRARRYSIWNNIPDPKDAWVGYVASIQPDKALRAEVDALSAATPGWSLKVPRTSTSTKAASWDVELAVKMILDGQTPTFVTAKPLQLLRRCVRLLQQDLDVETVAARVPCSLPHVQRVKAAMA
jgi:hypothetical protein